MSCLGYFSKNLAELRMPRTHGQPDKSGVLWKGPVTSGEIGLETAQQRAGICKSEPNPPLDPVLRAHLRLGS